MCPNCNSETSCTCKRKNNVVYTTGCAKIQDADCVTYKPLGGQSSLMSALGIGVKSKLSYILEKINLFLEENIEMELTPDQRTKTGLSENSNVKAVVETLVNAPEDHRVVASVSDPDPETLYNKISVKNCLTKAIVTKSDGKQYVEIGIDIDCLKLLLI